jgi:hypothetical protein
MNMLVWVTVTPSMVYVLGKLLHVHVIGNITAAVADIDADLFSGRIVFGFFGLHCCFPFEDAIGSNRPAPADGFR